MKLRHIGAAGLLLVSASCASSAQKNAGPTRTSVTTVTAGSQTAEPVWLCRPGSTPDPCVSDLATEVDNASGERSVQESAAVPESPFDCFYVYPTVSSEPGPNADLTVQAAEIGVARDQASRFSAVCRVWAPMYRQVTTAALFSGGVVALNAAYASLLSDWQYYLNNENKGRPIIFIGHSQGAAMLIRLLAEQVDPDAAVRSRLVVAILAGGNLQVPSGQTAGATFKNIPLCTSLQDPGCAIAYSTFGSEPPQNALFGRPGMGVSLMSLQLTSVGQQVACVNPASIPGGTGNLAPYFLRSGAVPWVTYPALYDATCQSSGGATWLQVTILKRPGDTRPVVTAYPGPDWGYHGSDINLALGNLVSDVSALESSYGH